MRLYHASETPMEPGYHLVASRPSNYYPTATKVMDTARPPGRPPRRTSIYCADSAEFALYFRTCQGGARASSLHIYEVEVKAFHKAPFALTHVICERIRAGQNPSSLITEYWNPNSNWHFYEYLTDRLKIVREIDHSDLNQIVLSHRATDDHERASRYI